MTGGAQYHRKALSTIFAFEAIQFREVNKGNPAAVETSSLLMVRGGWGI
jgi:hypothetical protein